MEEEYPEEIKELFAKVIKSLDKGNIEECKEVWERAIEKTKILGLNFLTEDLLYDIGARFYNKHMYKESLECFQQSLAIAKEQRDKKGERLYLNNIGEIFVRLGEYKKAFEYHQQSLFHNIIQSIDKIKTFLFPVLIGYVTIHS